MITAGTDLRVLVATRPVDFRKQADGLAAIVQAAHGADPFCGAVYLFRLAPRDLPSPLDGGWREAFRARPGWSRIGRSHTFVRNAATRLSAGAGRVR